LLATYVSISDLIVINSFSTASTVVCSFILLVKSWSYSTPNVEVYKTISFIVYFLVCSNTTLYATSLASLSISALTPINTDCKLSNVAALILSSYSVFHSTVKVSAYSLIILIDASLVSCNTLFSKLALTISLISPMITSDSASTAETVSWS